MVTSYVDWSSGLRAYWQAVEDFDKEDKKIARRIRKRHKGDGTLVMGGPAIREYKSTREAWVEMVCGIVSPEFATDVLLFGTFTFANYNDVDRGIIEEPPGVQKGRNAIEAFMKGIDDYVDSYFIVEERGTQNNRLHYHSLLRVDRSANIAIPFTSRMCKLWRHGYSKLEEARGVAEAISYSTKYVLKGQYSSTCGFWAKRSTRVLQLRLE